MREEEREHWHNSEYSRFIFYKAQGFLPLEDFYSLLLCFSYVTLTWKISDFANMFFICYFYLEYF
jgi:hypothetical protein